MKTYTFDEVVAALNTVQPYDWAGFLNQRLKSLEPHAPLGGIEGPGWKLAYDDKPSAYWKAAESERKFVDVSYSLGMRMKEDGTVLDVHMGGPAQEAGVAPATQIIAVNRRQFSPAVLHDAIAAQKRRTQEPLRLVPLRSRSGPRPSCAPGASAGRRRS